MKINSIKLCKYSDIEYDFSISEDGSILIAKYSGIYRKGSEGNPDAWYMYSLLVAHYFVFEPISLIIDISQLEYSWGNTILKLLNFFTEIGRDEDEKNKKLIILVSDINKKEISDLLEIVHKREKLICFNFEEAINYAKEQVVKYLED